jgi:hypothetical protein
MELRSKKRKASVKVAPQNLSGQKATLAVEGQPESSTGLEIGALFVRAQRFADETANEAKQKAQEVISAAEAKAAEIIQRATDAESVAQAKVVSTQAQEAAITEGTRQQARPIAQQTHPPIPAEAITTLSAAIEECTDTNRTLASELVKLRLTLGESFAAVPQAQHLHPDPIALTLNNSQETLLPPTSG